MYPHVAWHAWFLTCPPTPTLIMLEETLELHQLRSSGIRDPRAGRRELNQYLIILNNIIIIIIIFIRIIINYY